MSCPADCLERHQSNSKWIRAAVQLALACFVALGGLYVYADGAYAKAATVEEAKQVMKDQRTEIREEFRTINAKLDALSLRGK